MKSSQLRSTRQRFRRQQQRECRGAGLRQASRTTPPFDPWIHSAASRPPAVPEQVLGDGVGGRPVLAVAGARGRDQPEVLSPQRSCPRGQVRQLGDGAGAAAVADLLGTGEQLCTLPKASRRRRRRQRRRGHRRPPGPRCDNPSRASHPHRHHLRDGPLQMDVVDDEEVALPPSCASAISGAVTSPVVEVLIASRTPSKTPSGRGGSVKTCAGFSRANHVVEAGVTATIHPTGSAGRCCRRPRSAGVPRGDRQDRVQRLLHRQQPRATGWSGCVALRLREATSSSERRNSGRRRPPVRSRRCRRWTSRRSSYPTPPTPARVHRRRSGSTW